MPLLPPRGAVSTLGLEFVRELEPEDIARLEGVPATTPPMIQTLKAAHHRQAQLIARGLYSDLQVARLCGITPTRVSQLKRDPSFQKLVHDYQVAINEATLEASTRVQEKLLVAGEAALDEINERLEDDAERKKMSVGELRQITEMAADRTVAPPKTAVPSATPPATITLNFGTEIRVPSEPIVIDAEPSAPACTTESETEAHED